MRLCHYTGGHWAPVPLERRCYEPEEVCDMLMVYSGQDGSVHGLCVDFCGEYLPIVSHSDFRLVSVLATAYHNANLRENTEVCIPPI